MTSRETQLRRGRGKDQRPAPARARRQPAAAATDAVALGASRAERPTCPAQLAPMGIRQWVSYLRKLQKQVEAGELDDCALQMFQASREELERVLLVAQQIARGFRHAPRRAVRVACEIPVELELRGGRVGAITVDVSVLGFATSLDTELAQSEEVAFTLRLPGASRAVKGRARMVSQTRSRTEERLRSAFAFSSVLEDGVSRLQAFVLDRIVRELEA